MTKLLAALAGHPRVGVDMNIAAGEAIDWWSRMKTTAIILLLVVCAVLTVGYLNLIREADVIKAEQARIHARQTQASKERQQIYATDKAIERQLGQLRARSRLAP